MARYGTPPTRAANPEHRLLYHEAAAGRMPAEALPTHLRWHLVAVLHRRGWEDTEIACHTRMTLYTTARIRSSLGLAPNRPRAGRKTA